MLVKKVLHLVGIDIPTSFKTSCNPLDKRYKVAPCDELHFSEESSISHNGSMLRKLSFTELTEMQMVEHVKKLHHHHHDDHHHFDQHSEEHPKAGLALKSYPKKQSAVGLSDLYVQVSMVRKLTHKNLMDIKKIYEDDESFHFLYEVPPLTLPILNYLTHPNHPFTEKAVACWIKQIFTALDYLHSHGITHGKLTMHSILIKPCKNHIMITGYEGNKLRPAPISEEPIHNSSFPVAPEIHSKRGYGQAADIWSLGILLSLFLSGQLPSPNISQSSLCSSLKKISMYNKKDPSMSLSNPNLPPLAKNLLSQIQVEQPLSRPTAHQALEHPWFSSQLSEEPLLESLFYFESL